MPLFFDLKSSSSTSSSTGAASSSSAPIEPQEQAIHHGQQVLSGAKQAELTHLLVKTSLSAPLDRYISYLDGDKKKHMLGTSENVFDVVIKSDTLQLPLDLAHNERAAEICAFFQEAKFRGFPQAASDQSVRRAHELLGNEGLGDDNAIVKFYSYFAFICELSQCIDPRGAQLHGATPVIPSLATLCQLVIASSDHGALKSIKKYLHLPRGLQQVIGLKDTCAPRFTFCLKAVPSPELKARHVEQEIAARPPGPLDPLRDSGVQPGDHKRDRVLLRMECLPRRRTTNKKKFSYHSNSVTYDVSADLSRKGSVEPLSASIRACLTEPWMEASGSSGGTYLYHSANSYTPSRDHSASSAASFQLSASHFATFGRALAALTRNKLGLLDGYQLRATIAFRTAPLETGPALASIIPDSLKSRSYRYVRLSKLSLQPAEAWDIVSGLHWWNLGFAVSFPIAVSQEEQRLAVEDRDAQRALFLQTEEAPDLPETAKRAAKRGQPKQEGFFKRLFSFGSARSSAPVHRVGDSDEANSASADGDDSEDVSSEYRGLLCVGRQGAKTSLRWGCFGCEGICWYRMGQHSLHPLYSICAFHREAYRHREEVYQNLPAEGKRALLWPTNRPISEDLSGHDALLPHTLELPRGTLSNLLKSNCTHMASGSIATWSEMDVNRLIMREQWFPLPARWR